MFLTFVEFVVGLVELPVPLPTNRENAHNIHQVTDRLQKLGYKINNSDKPIQVSEDGLLLQSSIESDKVRYQFLEKEEWVPGCFVELIERRHNPITGKKRDGFESNNANVIFESTNGLRIIEKK